MDAIISSMLCEGVTMPHTLGIGGGFFMTIYEKSKSKVSTIIARETAPAKSTIKMYNGDPNLSQKGEDEIQIITIVAFNSSYFETCGLILRYIFQEL